MTTPYDNTQQGRPYPFWWGYWWLGPVQIPPLPPWFGLTDRVTGTVYWLTLSTDQQHIVMSTTTPVGPQRIFGPWDGPFIGQYGLRLGISNGRAVVDSYPNQGAGPWARTPTNNQAIAGLIALALKTPSQLDHLGFVIGSATHSIFSAPKPFFFDAFPPGNTSDVLVP